MLLWILLFWSIVSFFPLSSQGEEPQVKETLLRLLPLESDLKGWTPDEEPQTAQGVGLFDLINGGAEQYVKAGFSRAVLATYRNKEGKRIHLDIYEMLSPESARSIYRKKAGDGGKKGRVIPRNCVPGRDYDWPNRSDRPREQTDATGQGKRIDRGAVRTGMGETPKVDNHSQQE